MKKEGTRRENRRQENPLETLLKLEARISQGKTEVPLSELSYRTQRNLTTLATLGNPGAKQARIYFTAVCNAQTAFSEGRTSDGIAALRSALLRRIEARRQKESGGNEEFRREYQLERFYGHAEAAFDELVRGYIGIRNGERSALGTERLEASKDRLRRAAYSTVAALVA